MRKKFYKTRFVAMGLAAAMVLSMVNVPAVSNWQPPMASVQAAENNEPVWMSTENMVFTTGTDDAWNDKDMATGLDYALGTNVRVTAKVTVDGDTSKLDGQEDTDAAGNWNLIQIISVLKAGSLYTQAPTADLKASDFVDGVANVEFTGYVTTDEEKTALTGNLSDVIFKYNAHNYDGTITISDVKVYSEAAEEGGGESGGSGSEGGLGAEGSGTEIPAAGTLWSATAAVDTNAVTFGTAEDWDWDNTLRNEFTGNDAELPADAVLKGKMTIDKAAYESLGDEDYIKFAFKFFNIVGDWDSVQELSSYPMYKKAAFADNGDNTYTAAIEVDLGKKITKFASLLMQGVGTNFTGKVTFSDMSIVKEEEPVLTPTDPTVVGAFDTEADMDNWTSEAGWDYSHGKDNPVKADGTPTEPAEVQYNAEKQALQLNLDYSKDTASGWSEAKVTGSFDAINIKNYNALKFTLYYPSDMATVRTKVFMKGANEKEIINSEGEFRSRTVEAAGEGWSKVTIRSVFKPTDTTVSSVTLGIVGPYADLSKVYIDDVTLLQMDVTEDYVKITETPDATADQASLENWPAAVKLVDAQATDEAKALAAYLQGLQANDQVLFGHQNSTFRSVNSDGETSDIKDITGSEAGLFGIDTLALTGVENSAGNTEAGLAASIAASKKAYDAGSIVSLSCHMPNFTNSKIVASDDKYGYSFSKCDFAESKDTSPCADLILEGGAYNAQFNAYLDIIADYALALQDANVPVLFRPFHENSGNWFWWGTSTSVASYKAMWRYMVEYMQEKGVHNLLYVYSPNGPIGSETAYLERYPGDEYVDVLGFDYYDDYGDVTVYTGDEFFKNIGESCKVVAGLAAKKNKIPAIAESGIRITGADKDSLMVSGNPTFGKDWYNKLINTAVANDIPYFLLWANFDSSNFFVPFKYNDEYGQEMINDFIKAYNNDSAIFGSGTRFYTEATAKASDVTATGYSTEVTGYMIQPKDYMVIKEAYNLQGFAKNAKKVEFKVQASAKAEAICVAASRAADSNLYTAKLDKDTLAKLGKTSTGIVTLVADGKELGKASFINFNKDADVMPQYIFDNFEYYYGDNGLFQSKYGTHNSAANCESSFSLNAENKVEGEYSGAFTYKLTYPGSGEVWTGGLGRSFENNDFSAYNAISMWVKPDGNGQKLVLQLKDSAGKEYEAYLTNFVKGTKAQYVTVPFSKIMKKGSTTDSISASDIKGFAIWCNSVPENYKGEKDGTKYTVNGTIYFDDIKAVKVSGTDLAKADQNGLIITDTPLKDLSGNNPDPKDPTTEAPTTEKPSTEATTEAPKKEPNIQASKQTTTSVTLKWKKNAKAKGYYVYAYDSAKKKYVKVKDTTKTSAKITKISGKKLKAGTTYKFKVTAYTKSGKKKVTIKNSTYKLSAATSPKKVTVSSLKKKSSTKATLKWKKVSGASGYQIYMKTGSGKYKCVKTIKKGKTTSYTKSGLKKGKKYTFKVRAYKKVSGKTVYGSYSKTKSIKMK